MDSSHGPNVSRTRTEGTPLSSGASPNSLWCADYKGEFRLGNQRYCYPLTVTDHASRYLLLCEAMESNQEQFAFTAFERLLFMETVKLNVLIASAIVTRGRLEPAGIGAGSAGN